MDARPLNYAPRVLYFQRRALHRTALALVIACLLAWAGFKWGPRAWEHAKILYWQRAVMRYSPPPDQLVYESDPVRARALLKSDTFEELTGSYGEAALRIAPAWDSFASLTLPYENHPGATLFAHARQNSLGQPRIVVVIGGWPTSVLHGGQSTDTVEVEVIIVRPGTWASMPSELTPLNYPHWIQLPLPAPIRHVQWFAGQPDPMDESHFTIAYCVDGGRGLVDGWLGDDDQVVLESRRLSGR